MKPFLVGAIVVLLGGALGLAGGELFQAGTPPAATPGPDDDAPGNHLVWEPLGGPYERVAYALALLADPRRSTLYMGTWGHGVYRSRVDHDGDGEVAWQDRRNNGGRYINALAVLPSSPNVVYAGTAGEGLWLSENGGNLWRQLGSYSGFTEDASLTIESLLILPEDGGPKLYAGTHNGVWASGAFSDTWTQLDAGFADEDAAFNVQALVHDPAGWLYAGTLDGLYGSRDRGQTWQFLGPPDGYPDQARRVLSLAVLTSTARPTGTLFIGTQCKPPPDSASSIDTQCAGVYALDPDQTWLTRTTGLQADARARTIQALLNTPDGRLYAGTVDWGVYVSMDEGETWHPIVEGLPSHARSILVLAFDPTDRTLYAGTYGDGVYRLRHGSLEWEAINAGHPVDLAVQEIVFAGSSGENLYAGLRVGGLYLNADLHNGDPTWRRVPTALPIGPARDVVGMAVGGPDRATLVIAAATGIFYRAGADAPWLSMEGEAGLPDGDVTVKALAQGRQDPDRLYVALGGGTGLYRSDDAGASWQSARGDLDVDEPGLFSTLAVGAQDRTVYLGLETGQVYRTDDAGGTWRQLSRVVSQGLRALEWSHRSSLDVFLHGGPQTMLYARTSEGVYVSYDEGQSWQLRLRGFFTALLADPHRPWAVYVASPATTLDKEFQASIPLPPDVWLSDDGGETWRLNERKLVLPGEPVPASITTLALNPQDARRLYAGTEGAGVFWAFIPAISRPFTPRAVGAMLAGIALLALALFILQTGWTRGRPYGLSPLTWPVLAWLRLRRGDELGLVSNPHTPLTPLERLALAHAPAGSFRPMALWQDLDEVDVPADPSQVEAALNRLASDYRLLRRSARDYRLTSSWLGRIARARFWDITQERERLIEQVRGQSRLRAIARRFFKLVGFDTSAFEEGLTLASNRPEYALLGAERGIYAHLHTGAAVGAASVEEVRDNALRVYEGQLAGKIAFFVLSGRPEFETFESMAQLRQDQDFRLVLLSYDRLFRTTETPLSRRTLDEGLQRALGKRDLFRLEGHVRESFDFFGREAQLQKLVAACQAGDVVGLGGMARVGKTSLARQLVGRLPDALVAWLEWDDTGPSPSYMTVREAWLAEARARFPAWEPPRLASLPEQPTVEQMVADLGGIRDSLLQAATGVKLLVIVDGLPDQSVSEPVGMLAQVLAEIKEASLVGIFETWPRHETPFAMQDALRPFAPATSAALVRSLAIQIGLRFESAAQEQLHRASGGHPLLLRQLASLAVAETEGGRAVISEVAVENAVSRYVSRPASTLSRLWDSLLPEEQQLLQAAVGGGPLTPGAALDRLVALGWLETVEGRWRLFSGVLERCLRERHPGSS